MYEELEFYSFLKKTKTVKQEEVNYKIVKDINEININEKSAVYLEVLGTNYHKSEILGLALYNKNESIYIPKDILLKEPSFLTEQQLITYDEKKIYVVLKENNIEIKNIEFDTMLEAYLLEKNVKDDIAYLANIIFHSMKQYLVNMQI